MLLLLYLWFILHHFDDNQQSALHPHLGIAFIFKASTWSVLIFSKDGRRLNRWMPNDSPELKFRQSNSYGTYQWHFVPLKSSKRSRFFKAYQGFPDTGQNGGKSHGAGLKWSIARIWVIMCRWNGNGCIVQQAMGNKDVQVRFDDNQRLTGYPKFRVKGFNTWAKSLPPSPHLHERPLLTILVSE